MPITMERISLWSDSYLLLSGCGPVLHGTATALPGQPPPEDTSANASLPLQICPGDANGDGAVDSSDVDFIFVFLGCDVSEETTSCSSADQNEDGQVDSGDIGFAESRFGATPGGATCKLLPR